ncbi:MAG: hypothetical protein WD648_11405 [Planctomycetaceae bacterium]
MSAVAHGQSPNPVLTSIFPPGGQAGTAFEVTVAGTALDAATSIDCACPGLTFKPVEQNRFAATVGADVPTGTYDVRVVGAAGMSSPRAFYVGTRPEINEQPAVGETPAAATGKPAGDASADLQSVPLNSVVNGRIEKPGDVDQYRFAARAGDRVLIECRAERIDSKLRAVLELYDSKGRRISTNRGFFGVDPLIDFWVREDGEYIVKLFDLTYTGGEGHFYRMSIDTGPRVAFAVPAAVQAATTAKVALYGWNLLEKNSAAATAASNVIGAGAGPIPESGPQPQQQNDSLHRPVGGFERVDVEITAPKNAESGAIPLLLRPEQASLDMFAYRFPHADEPIALCLSDLPVVCDEAKNHAPETAQRIGVPSEVCGQLTAGDERDWFSLEARRGDVLWVEAFGQRIGAPVDLDLAIFDASAKQELAQFHDELANPGGRRFPTAHLDPSGRWVAPADGRFLLVVRNLIGSGNDDPRRVYRLSIRREDPEFHVVIIPSEAESPSGLNVPRGGRAPAEVLAFRSRGMTGGIRVSARDLPPGVDCPDVWLGPDVDRTFLTVSARENAPTSHATLKLFATAEASILTASRDVRGGVMIHTDVPNGSGRMTNAVPLAVAGEIGLRLTAETERPKYPQGSIVNIAVDVERRTQTASEIKLAGLGLPESIDNQTAEIRADASRGYLCVRLPKTLAPGRYTIVVRGETTVASTADPKLTTTAILYSNPVSFDVYPAPYLVEVDLNAPRKIKRREIIQLAYSARRKNGFIGKIHTDLFAPGGVVGIRGRGVTFVGQVETGIIQIVASDDAPLGPIKFLQLDALGTVEDEPIYHGSCFVDLEIIE